MIRLGFSKKQKVLLAFDLKKVNKQPVPVLGSKFSLVGLGTGDLLLTSRVLFKINKTGRLRSFPFLTIFPRFEQRCVIDSNNSVALAPVLPSLEQETLGGVNKQVVPFSSLVPQLVATTVAARNITWSLVNHFNQLLSSSSRFWFSELELVGLGYRLTIRNLTLRFRLGFSHVIVLPLPPSVWILKRKKRILLYSTDKAVLTLFVSILLKLKRMSAYKVKGLKKKDQVFKLKPGKKRAK